MSQTFYHQNVLLTTVSYTVIRSLDDAIQLQKDLEKLKEWERDWLMEFHAQKCQVMHVTKKGNPMKKNYTIHGVTLQETIGAKYQNVSLHKSLSWKNHIDQVAKKANSTRAFLQRNTKQTKELCYKTLMRPIIEYASVIWGPFTVDDIRKLGMIQRRSVRFVMVASQKC